MEQAGEAALPVDSMHRPVMPRATALARMRRKADATAALDHLDPIPEAFAAAGWRIPPRSPG